MTSLNLVRCVCGDGGVEFIKQGDGVCECVCEGIVVIVGANVRERRGCLWGSGGKSGCGDSLSMDRCGVEHKVQCECCVGVARLVCHTNTCHVCATHGAGECGCALISAEVPAGLDERALRGRRLLCDAGGTEVVLAVGGACGGRSERVPAYPARGCCFFLVGCRCAVVNVCGVGEFGGERANLRCAWRGVSVSGERAWCGWGDGWSVGCGEGWSVGCGTQILYAVNEPVFVVVVGVVDRGTFHLGAFRRLCRSRGFYCGDVVGHSACCDVLHGDKKRRDVGG